ncbi:uncharacterized protein J3R85_019822 [Psidium guajava]|nr:uncharacterized protein J3R85_019822 [Psidium guajava]
MDSEIKLQKRLKTKTPFSQHRSRHFSEGNTLSLSKKFRIFTSSKTFTTSHGNVPDLEHVESIHRPIHGPRPAPSNLGTFQSRLTKEELFPKISKTKRTCSFRRSHFHLLSKFIDHLLVLILNQNIIHPKSTRTVISRAQDCPFTPSFTLFSCSHPISWSCVFIFFWGWGGQGV